ncbi:hypothetical protein DSOL_4659 [Desulfosporosinus metallidurans]|uniref:Uncharacterized protein n=1 Tax=Desulfosporosinus metallidurans TaxID=1888891 RepID=A0A1Q8QIT3_9FIRM|nr:hypothetical protein DSOL_4659 [Desulfosporosinus metallidurans]
MEGKAGSSAKKKGTSLTLSISFGSMGIIIEWILAQMAFYL